LRRTQRLRFESVEDLIHRFAAATAGSTRTGTGTLCFATSSKMISVRI